MTLNEPTQDQENLANLLFPIEEEYEESILSIPPEKRILRTEQYDFSVHSLIDMLRKHDVVIPDYQRAYVWSDRQASRLIESLIIQCPLPVIYLNQEKNETFTVIDGNQRLRSLERFVADEFQLQGLTTYPELIGIKYSELDRRFQRHISNRVLRCTVILKETHPQVKFDVFERLNSGAVALTRQELRHGLYYGSLVKAASEVAVQLNLENWIGSKAVARKKDEELVIRFWALSSSLNQYEKPFSAFISNYVESNRSVSTADIEKLKKYIQQTFTRSLELFGENCFSFAKVGASRFNSAVFDAHMIACSNLSDGDYSALLSRTAEIKAGYENLQCNEAFAKSVTLATSDKNSILKRIHSIRQLLKMYL